jgi:hypothetical protein
MNLVFDIVLICLVSFLMFLVLRARVRRELGATALRDSVRKELGLLIAELNRTTERNVAIIEDRIKRLGATVGAADKRIASLADALAFARAQAIEAAAPAATPPASPVIDAREAPAASRFDAAAITLADRVMEMHRNGISAPIIARNLAAPVGEIELIIALRERS